MNHKHIEIIEAKHDLSPILSLAFFSILVGLGFIVFAILLDCDNNVGNDTKDTFLSFDFGGLSRVILIIFSLMFIISGFFLAIKKNKYTILAPVISGVLWGGGFLLYEIATEQFLPPRRTWLLTYGISFLCISFGKQALECFYYINQIKK